MSEQASAEHFDLARFVLGYLEHEGSLVAPPAYGVHEVLMTDALAAQLAVDPFLRLAFDAEPETGTLRLSVNHRLVEAMAERLEQVRGNAQVAINHVRLEKRGLFDVAAKAFSFPNARLSAKRDAVEQAALHHFLRFNFKATFLGDEKQEQIVSVMLDVQGGYPVRERLLLERLVSSETESAFPQLAVAQPRWPGAGEALAPATLQTLLLRAQAGAELDLADRLSALRARMERFLELDVARVEDYYDSLERDLQQRLARSGVGEEERRGSIESKIEALRAERTAKLADVEARYQVRVELELINTLLIVQPKVILPVEIGNRRVTITRLAVWDPLVHRLEPLVCDVCGMPGEGLHLCTSGHLAHRGCMAPRCVECNREYCLLCADQVQACVVCSRPVCRASLRLCPTCGRSTCAEHKDLCHAAGGEPVLLKDLPAAEPRKPEPPARPAEPEPKPPSKPLARKPAGKPRPAAKPVTPPAAPVAPSIKAVRLNVEVYEEIPRIVAFVMRSTNRVLATRTIELMPEGILVQCDCEKSACPANGWVHWPANAGQIHQQVRQFLSALRQEYNLPPKRVDYFYVRGLQIDEKQDLILPVVWRDERRLAEAREGFDRKSRGGDR